MVLEREAVVSMGAVAVVSEVVSLTSKPVDIDVAVSADVEIDVMSAGVLVKTCAVVMGTVVSSAVDVGLVAAAVGERDDLVMEVEEAEEGRAEGAGVVKATDVVEIPTLLGTPFVVRGGKVALGADVVGAAVVAADVCLGDAVERETVVVAGIFVVFAALKVLPARVVAGTEDSVAVLAGETVVVAGGVVVNKDGETDFVRGDVVSATIVEKLEAGVLLVMDIELVGLLTLVVVGRDLVVFTTDLVIWAGFIVVGPVEEKLGISVGLSNTVADELVSATVLMMVVGLVVGAPGLGEVVNFVVKITGFKVVVDLIVKAAGVEFAMDLVEEITLVVVVGVVIVVEGSLVLEDLLVGTADFAVVEDLGVLTTGLVETVDFAAVVVGLEVEEDLVVDASEFVVGFLLVDPDEMAAEALVVTKNGPEDTVLEVFGLRFVVNFPGCVVGSIPG